MTGVPTGVVNAMPGWRPSPYSTQQAPYGVVVATRCGPYTEQPLTTTSTSATSNAVRMASSSERGILVPPPSGRTRAHLHLRVQRAVHRALVGDLEQPRALC